MDLDPKTGLIKRISDGKNNEMFEYEEIIDVDALKRFSDKYK